MKYIYLSSGQFGAVVLEDLEVKPVLVITQPDKKGGRGLKQMMATPVKQYCLKQKLSFVENLDQVELSRFDLALVADFGVIIPQNLLNQPKLGFFNIHPSLLPKYRGSTPLQSAIISGEKQTGVSIIKMDQKVDHGDLVAQDKIDISINDTYLTLLTKTATLGARLINDLDFNQVKLTVQNHQEATYTKKLTKQDGYVAIEQLIPYLTPIFTKYNLLHLLPNQAEKPIDPQKLHNLICGLSPWPGVWTKLFDGRTLKISRSSFNNIEESLVVNEVQIETKSYER